MNIETQERACTKREKQKWCHGKKYNKPHGQRKMAADSYKIIKLAQGENVVMIKEQ